MSSSAEASAKRRSLVRAMTWKARYVRCSCGLRRKERARARATLSRIVRHEPREASSLSDSRSWVRSLRVANSLVSGSVIVGVWGSDWGSGSGSEAMVFDICFWWRLLRL